MHTHTCCICTTSRQLYTASKKASNFLGAHTCVHTSSKIYCRSTSNSPLPANARHSFLIPMHTRSARHSLGRRTPPRRPDLPSASQTTASPINHRFPIRKVLRAAAAPRITEQQCMSFSCPKTTVLAAPSSARHDEPCRADTRCQTARFVAK